MGVFDFFKRKLKKSEPIILDINADRIKWTGKDFEFLIVGEINIKPEDFEKIMTPNTIDCQKIERDDWIYFKTDKDEFSYSWEMPGIQMTFNSEISFLKAKQIADEVVENIISTGQFAELKIIENSKIYRFN